MGAESRLSGPGRREVVLSLLRREERATVLASLYRPRELNLAEGKSRNSTPDLARQMMAVLIPWFAERKFVFLGDEGYASHDLALFCYRHRRHATLVNRFHGDAKLYAPPLKRRNRTARPRTKGRKLPSPKQVVAHSKLAAATVGWYRGGQRRVQLASGNGHWYKGGEGLLPIR